MRGINSDVASGRDKSPKCSINGLSHNDPPKTSSDLELAHEPEYNPCPSILQCTMNITDPVACLHVLLLCINGKYGVV